MVVALLTVELHVHGSRSLKDKRMVVRRVKDRLKKYRADGDRVFNVSLTSEV